MSFPSHDLWCQRVLLEDHFWNCFAHVPVPNTELEAEAMVRLSQRLVWISDLSSVPTGTETDSKALGRRYFPLP